MPNFAQTAFSEVRSIEEGRVFSLLKPQPIQLAAGFLLVAPDGGDTGMGAKESPPYLLTPTSLQLLINR